METDGDARRALAGEGDMEGTALLAEFGTWLAQSGGCRGSRCAAMSSRPGCSWPLVRAAPEETVRELDAGQVTRFVTGYCQDRNRWSAKAMVTALRAFLRFAHATGRTAVPLAGAVPAVAAWRLAALPRGLSAGEVERLLAGCDRTLAGRPP